MHTANRFLQRYWALLPALLLLALSACQLSDIAAREQEPAPVVCGDCETCLNIPHGPALVGPPSNYGWPGGVPDDSVVRGAPVCNPRNDDEILYGRTTLNPQTSGLWIANLRTRQEHQFLRPGGLPLNIGGWSGYPAWGKAGWLAIAASQRIWVVKADGDSLHQLSTAGDADYRAPQWSPDGRQLLCMKTSRSGRQVVLLDLHGQELRTLSLPNVMVLDMAWSPDGQQLALQSDFGSGIGLYRYDLRTNQLTFIVDTTMPPASGATPQELSWFRWLPDNRTLVFTGGNGLFRLDTQTGQTLLLHKGCNSRTYFYPAVSADGRSIVVDRTDLELRGTPQLLYGQHTLYIMDAYGRNERKIF